jgi:hypothetical protein
MKAELLFEKQMRNFQVINTDEKIEEIYKDLILTYKDFDVIESFTQLKKHQSGLGLALEIMFFNDKYILDIVVSNNNIDHYILKIKEVTSLYLSTSNINLESSVSDSITLRIMFKESVQLFYVTEKKRYLELINLKNALLKYI